MADTLESLAAALASLRTQVEALTKQLGDGRAGFATEPAGGGSAEPIETFRVSAPLSAPDVLIAGRSVGTRINANRADIGRLEELTDDRLSRIEAGEIAAGEWRLAGRVALSTDDGGQNLVLGSAEFESGVNVVGDVHLDSATCENLRARGKVSILGEIFGEPGAPVPFQTPVDFKQLVKVNRIMPFDRGTVEIDGNGLTVAGFVQILDRLVVGSVLDLSDPTTAGGIEVEGIVRARQVLSTGGDVAEHIPVRAGIEATPGMVMVIATEGDLIPCDSDHDPRVAGVVAGAGGLDTAMLMKAGEKGAPIALAGTIYCNCDADFGAIAPGDLLTTSATPGFARRTSAMEARPGTVIGKALSALDRGRGQILTLVGHR